jgi:hypothetical protein
VWKDQGLTLMALLNIIIIIIIIVDQDIVVSDGT